MLLGKIVFCQRDVSVHTRQDVVEVVCDSAGQRSNALELVQFQKFFLRTLAFCNVSHHSAPRDQFPVLPLDVCRIVQPNDLPILLNEPIFDVV